MEKKKWKIGRKLYGFPPRLWGNYLSSVQKIYRILVSEDKTDICRLEIAVLSVKNNNNIMNSEIPGLFFNDIQKTSLTDFLIPVLKMK